MTGMRHLNQGLIVTSPDAKRRAISWCVENGVNPDSIPLYARIDVIDEQHLEIEVYDLTAGGQRTWDEKTQTPKTRWLHVKSTRPFPDDLLED